MLTFLREKNPWKDLPKPVRMLIVSSTVLWITGMAILEIFPKSLASASKPRAASLPEMKNDEASTPGVVTFGGATASAGKEGIPADSAKRPDSLGSIATQVSERRDEDPTALRRVIVLYLANGEYAKAMPFVDRALASGQKDSALLDQAARVYLAVGEYAKALNAASEGLQQDSSQVELWRVAAMSRFRLGQCEAGMALAHKALNRFPNQMDLLVDLGAMEIEMGSNYPDYGKALKRALQVNPNSTGALYLSGRKQALEGNYGDAETAFRSVLKRDSTHAKAWAQLGIALYQQGKFPEAGDNFIAALRLNPKDYNTWYNLGEWYEDDWNAKSQTGELQSEEGKSLRAKALQCYLHAVELNPGHVQAHFRIGVLMHGNGEFKEAIRHFEAAVQLDSTYAMAWFQMGVAYQRLSMTDKARECVQRAFELDPLNRLVIAKLRELS